MKILFTLIFLGSFCFADSLVFKEAGKGKSELTLETLKKQFKVEEVTVWEPHEDKEVTYVGIDFREILKSVYQENWKKTEEILLTCSDGYQPSIPVRRFLEHKAYLVFQRKNSDFILKDRFHQNDKVELGPFYLVWDNLKSDELKAEGASGWPWALVGVDLIQFSVKFPHMAPPRKSSESVQRGFLLFRAKCLQCHSINGEGGTKGVELNRPVSVTQYFQPKYLRQWIQDPSSIRENAAMPKYNMDAPKAKQELDDIISYLKAVAKK